jgi:excisionase family DNA binding protein
MKLLSIEAVAEALDVSRQTVARMIAGGQLPAVCLRAGRRKKVWRVRSELLEKWIINKERETAGQNKIVSNGDQHDVGSPFHRT